MPHNDRKPFEYVGDCDGPSVNTDIVPSGFTSCEDVVYTHPTLALQDYQMTVPDVAPPPLCNGLGSVTASGTMEGISGSLAISSSGSACSPDLTVSYSFKVPCIGFTTSVNASISTGSIIVGLTPNNETCQLDLDVAISLPAGFGETGPAGPAGPEGPEGPAGPSTGVLFTAVYDVFLDGLDIMKHLKVVKVIQIVTDLGAVVAITGIDCSGA